MRTSWKYEVLRFMEKNEKSRLSISHFVSEYIQETGKPVNVWDVANVQRWMRFWKQHNPEVRDPQWGDNQRYASRRYKTQKQEIPERVPLYKTEIVDVSDMFNNSIIKRIRDFFF